MVRCSISGALTRSTLRGSSADSMTYRISPTVMVSDGTSWAEVGGAAGRRARRRVTVRPTTRSHCPGSNGFGMIDRCCLGALRVGGYVIMEIKSVSAVLVARSHLLRPWNCPSL